MAARKDTCSYVDCLEYLVNPDHPYTEKKVRKMAKSRFLTCTIAFKQNIGHLGKEIFFWGVHGNYRTMEWMWPLALHRSWDLLACMLNRLGIQLLAGDFNNYVPSASRAFTPQSRHPHN